MIPIPVAGGIIGGVVGGVIGSIVASTVAKKATSKVYDINLSEKCPLCPKISLSPRPTRKHPHMCWEVHLKILLKQQNITNYSIENNLLTISKQDYKCFSYDNFYDIKISYFMSHLLHYIGFGIIVTKFKFIIAMANDINVLDEIILYWIVNCMISPLTCYAIIYLFLNIIVLFLKTTCCNLQLSSIY